MPADVFASIIHSADQEQTSASYAYDNATRGGRADELAIQRTVRGEAWFRDEKGTHVVGEGRAMLFTHDEKTAYGFPKGATDPYELRFATFLAGSLAAPFAQLRKDFGSVVNMPDGSEATELLNEINARFNARSFRDRFQESELLYRLVIALYREQIAGTRTSDPIEFGYHYLRNQFRSPINLKAVAEKCDVSREHFIREFAQRYNESPGAMLRRLRLEQARAMLAATTADVESIALASGYASSNSFCRAYRQKYGKSPRGAGGG